VVLSVTEDLGGIGYSGIGYKTSGVKAIALAKKDGEKAYEANYENVLQKKYPLGRMLYLYVAKAPNKPLPKMTEEFLKYVLSKAGLEIVVKDGYLPLPAPIALKQLAPLKYLEPAGGKRKSTSCSPVIRTGEQDWFYE
jgi:phosphate transport system substrate-binding protein